MNFAKLFQGTIVGALFSGLLSAICAVYIAFTSNSSSFGLEAKDIWWLAMLYAGFFGLITGGILGGIVSALNLSLIAAGLCGFLITAVPTVFIRLVLVFKKFNEDFKRFAIFFIAMTTLTGIFVSYIQMSSSKSE